MDFFYVALDGTGLVLVNVTPQNLWEMPDITSSKQIQGVCCSDTRHSHVAVSYRHQEGKAHWEASTDSIQKV